MTKNPSSFQPSKDMLNLVRNIANNSANKESKAPQQGSSQQPIDQTQSLVEQDTEKNEASLKEGGEPDKAEDSPAQSVGNEELQNSVKKDEGFILRMLKAAIKFMGGTIDEDGKEEEKNKSNALDEFKKFIFGDNSKGRVVEIESVTIPSPDLQNQNLVDSETPTQAPDSILTQDSNQAPTPPLNPRPAPAPAPPPPPHPRPAPSPTQNHPDQDQDQDPTQTPNSTSDKNEEKGENNADKLITQLIVELYEKEGKLDLLKQILDDEKGKDENKKNPEMQKLIQGFDNQIAEVEKGREQAAGKDGKATESNENKVAEEEEYDQNQTPEVTTNDQASNIPEFLKEELSEVCSEIEEYVDDFEPLYEGEEVESTNAISEKAAQEKEEGKGR